MPRYIVTIELTADIAITAESAQDADSTARIIVEARRGFQPPAYLVDDVTNIHITDSWVDNELEGEQDAGRTSDTEPVPGTVPGTVPETVPGTTT